MCSASGTARSRCGDLGYFGAFVAPLLETRVAEKDVVADLVREFSMLEYFRTLPARSERHTIRYPDLEDVMKRATELYDTDPYFHACVDVAVGAARRVFSKYETTGNGAADAE
jgi:hypothetical protein